MDDVGRADEREILFIGNSEDDPLVRVLQDVGVVALIQPARHYVRALHEPRMFAGFYVQGAIQNARHVRSGGVDDDAGLHIFAAAFAIQRRDPAIAHAQRGHKPRAHANFRTMFSRAERIGDDKAGVIHPTVGVGEALFI